MTQKTTLTARPARLIALAALLGAALGVGAIYVRSASERNESTVCSADASRVDRIKPFARGEVAAMLVPDLPRRLPALDFLDGAGRPVSLAGLKGKTVLLNLWATWCAPCREEMPALDFLQKELGGPDFEVVAVSIDTQDQQKARDFLAELKIANLAFD